MRTNSQKLLIYFDDEQHLVRRLGAAVVSCWGDFDPAIREKLIDRAKSVLEDDSGERLDADLRQFIALHDAIAARVRREAA